MKHSRNSRRIRRNTPHFCHSERTKVSRGIFPSSKLYLTLVFSATWWIPRLASLARNDMSWVVPFNQTGYIRYGASPSPGLDGGRLPPLHCVIPFNPTGCIRNIPRNGTQAVPYGFAGGCIFLHNVFQKRTRSSPIIVNCPLSIVNFFRCSYSEKRRSVLFPPPAGGFSFHFAQNIL